MKFTIKKHFIGVDIGTSGTKAILFDENGNIVSNHYSRYKLHKPQPLWAEQNPLEYFRATIECLEKITKSGGVEPESILSIGLTGQMHGLVLLDESDNVLRPAIIWCDNRTQDESNEIQDYFKDSLLSKTGNIANKTFTLSKLYWVKKHEPDIYSKIHKVLLPKDYVRYMLTGAFVSDYSDMSGTQLINIQSKEYDDDILSFLSLDRKVFPDVKSSFDISGPLKKELSKRLGMSNNVVVVGGAGDQAAGAFGNYIYDQETLNLSIGSSGVLFSISPLITDKTGAIQTFAFLDNNHYHVMGVTQGCGLSLKWLKDTFYQETPPNDFSLIDEEIKEVRITEELPIFLPYIQGERTPILDSKAKGIIFGLTANTLRPEIAYSVYEGVAFSFLHAYKALKKLGIDSKKIIVSGGGSGSKVLLRLIANILHKDLLIPHNQDTGCLGAAMIGAVGTGFYKSVQEAFNKMRSDKEFDIIKAESDADGLYEKRFSKYISIYKQNKNLFN